MLVLSGMYCICYHQAQSLFLHSFTQNSPLGDAGKFHPTKSSSSLPLLVSPFLAVFFPLNTLSPCDRQDILLIFYIPHENTQSTK